MAESDLPYRDWSSSEPFRAPPKRAPVREVSPTLRADEFARRSFELGLGAGGAHKLCPTWVDACRNSVGVGFSVWGVSRGTPHFSWGLALDYARFREGLTVDGTSLELQDTTTSLGLFGRVMPLADGRFDPFFELGMGGGRYRESGTVGDASSAAPIDEALFVPLLRAGLGLDVSVNDSFRLGTQFHWTHWLLSRAERCNDVAFGVCTLPSVGHFDVNNAAWSLRLGATFLFGGRH